MHRPEPNFNVAAQVIKQAELNPSDTAIIFEGTRRTYGEFAQRVRSLAGLLRGAGVCVGDRVGFLGFNQSCPPIVAKPFSCNRTSTKESKRMQSR